MGVVVAIVHTWLAGCPSSRSLPCERTEHLREERRSQSALPTHRSCQIHSSGRPTVRSLDLDLWRSRQCKPASAVAHVSLSLSSALPPGNKFAELKNTQWMAFFQITRVPENIRVRSKLKVQNSSTFQGPKLRFFQAPKLSTKSHILDTDIQNLDCNVTLKCTVLCSPIP